jgi:hypothetical protein
MRIQITTSLAAVLLLSYCVDVRAAGLKGAIEACKQNNFQTELL